MKIQVIPAFETNYLWLGIHEAKKKAFVVDPGDAEPILKYLREHFLDLTAILITHKHSDHIGGIKKLLKDYPNILVYAHRTEAIPQATHLVKEGDSVFLEETGDIFQVLDIPGHTLGHIAYYTKNTLFCGDTLFGAGCGRIFEGTPKQMFDSLTKLKNLPEATRVYCAHEYTLSNLKFALLVEPHNPLLQERFEKTKQMREKNISTVPFTIALEKQTNPFLRCDQPEIIQNVEAHIGRKMQNALETFSELRLWKNLL